MSIMLDIGQSATHTEAVASMFKMPSRVALKFANKPKLSSFGGTMLPEAVTPKSITACTLGSTSTFISPVNAGDAPDAGHDKD